MAHSIGPLKLADGVLPRHVYTYFFACFVSIGMFTYLTAMTPYILRVNIGLDQGSFGRVSGDLQFWHELVALSVIGWWGAMSDRFGRRSIYIIGFAILVVAYGIYAFATSVPQLVAFRLLFAFGIAAISALLSAVGADYPAEESRGKFTGLSFLLNGVGAVIFFMLLTKLPEIYAGNGASELWAGRYAYLTVAGIALIASMVMFGLKPGRPDSVKANKKHVPVSTLMAEGFKAGRNPRIAVSYLSSLAARADMAIITLFLILWVQNASVGAGMSAAQAAAKAGMTVGIAQAIGIFWAPLFGVIADRIDRLSLLIFGFSLAAIGYFWIGTQADILSTAAIPALLCMGIGQSSTILAANVILGQEAPADIRGSAFGMQAVFGAIGILLLSSIGGRLYDTFGPHAPFYTIAGANGLVALVGLIVRGNEIRTDSRKNRVDTAPVSS